MKNYGLQVMQHELTKFLTTPVDTAEFVKEFLSWKLTGKGYSIPIDKITVILDAEKDTIQIEIDDIEELDVHLQDFSIDPD